MWLGGRIPANWALWEHERIPPQVVITSGYVHACGGTGLARRRGERAGIRWWPGALGGLFCDKFLTHLKEVRVQFQLEPARRRLHVGRHVRPAPAGGRRRPRCGELHRIGADPFVRLPQQAARGQPQGTAQPLAWAVIVKRAQPDRHRPRARPARPAWTARLIGHLAG